MQTPALGDPNYEGDWAHSKGGIVRVRREGEHYLVDNPYVKPVLIPSEDFVQPDGLHYYQHRGSLEGSAISWTNGVTWTKLDTAEKEATAADADTAAVKDRRGSRPRFFVARGQVQNVMFRQTLIRAMQKRGIEGGATNDSGDQSRVDLTMMDSGDGGVDQIVEALRDGRELNSWGARAVSLQEAESGMAIQDHRVNTVNVESFRWNPDVDMYI